MKIIVYATKELKKAHPTDAAFDIEADEFTSIEPDERRLISTGLKMVIPNGYCGILKSRSGLSVKQGVEVGAGVIDSDYRGEIKVNILNHGDLPFNISKGDRIAQMMIVPVPDVEIKVVDDLSPTNRGDNGFGSSGIGTKL